jgi:3-hydroxyacyl-CoA dehydrogenase
MSTTKPIRRVTIIGTGVIGGSWAALYLAKGLEVAATDIAPSAEAALKRFVDAAWPALKRLGLAPGASQSNLSFTPKIEAAVSGTDLVQENRPERLDFKQKLYGQLNGLLPPEVIIASSSSGLTMSEIQSACKSHPEGCVIGHRFNPPHLVPLVELVGGAKTSKETIHRVAEFYKSIGRRTIRVRKEMPGYVDNRLQAALAREVYADQRQRSFQNIAAAMQGVPDAIKQRQITLFAKCDPAFGAGVAKAVEHRIMAGA